MRAARTAGARMLLLPAVEDVDRLDAPALAMAALQLAALQARIATRLLMIREEHADQPADGAVLTAKQVAERLQVNPQWVYDHRDELGGAKAGGKVRFTEGGIMTALRRMRAAS